MFFHIESDLFDDPLSSWILCNLANVEYNPLMDGRVGPEGLPWYIYITNIWVGFYARHPYLTAAATYISFAILESGFFYSYEWVSNLLWYDFSKLGIIDVPRNPNSTTFQLIFRHQDPLMPRIGRNLVYYWRCISDWFY